MFFFEKKPVEFFFFGAPTAHQTAYEGAKQQQGKGLSSVMCFFWFAPEIIDLVKLCQIVIFHQPRFPWNKGISLTKPTIWGENLCEVAIIWPDWWLEDEIEGEFKHLSAVMIFSRQFWVLKVLKLWVEFTDTDDTHDTPLMGWWFWTKPFEKNMMRKSKWKFFPKVRDENRKCLSCHHLKWSLFRGRAVSFREWTLLAAISAVSPTALFFPTESSSILRQAGPVRVDSSNDLEASNNNQGNWQETH